MTIKQVGCDTPMTLDNVKVVDNIEKNIISLGQLLKNGAIMHGSENNLSVRQKGGCDMIFKQNKRDGLFYMKATRGLFSCLSGRILL